MPICRVGDHFNLYNHWEVFDRLINISKHATGPQYQRNICIHVDYGILWSVIVTDLADLVKRCESIQLILCWSPAPVRPACVIAKDLNQTMLAKAGRTLRWIYEGVGEERRSLAVLVENKDGQYGDMNEVSMREIASFSDEWGAW